VRNFLFLYFSEDLLYLKYVHKLAIKNCKDLIACTVIRPRAQHWFYYMNKTDMVGGVMTFVGVVNQTRKFCVYQPRKLCQQKKRLP
jgi:hypothetical protein